MRAIVHWLLRILSRAILTKYKPEVIAITGSVGKTSTREAIYAALSPKFRVRQSIRSYNDQIGVPMTILGLESPGRSITGWVELMFEGFRLLLHKDPQYPEMLIVEMGADHPGDIAYLVEFCPPKVGVLTAIAPAHVEFFKTIERVAKEKQHLVLSVPTAGAAVINADDERVMQIKPKLKSHVFTYGFTDHADVRASDMRLAYGERGLVMGMQFKIEHKGSTVPITLPNVIGRQHIYPGLAAVAVGLSYGMNIIEIGEGLSHYRGAPGRMHLVPGIKNTMLIDDTYNSSPLAARRAIEALAMVEISQGAERYAVLGDMLELGSMTEDEHAKIGELIAQYQIDFLVTAGEASKHIAHGAQEAGMEEHRIAKFNDSVSAGKFVQEKIKQGDVILIKGSQGVRMEKVTREVMANPLEAKQVLVRQYGKWLTS